MKARSEREKILFVFLGLFLVLYLYYNYYLVGQLDQINTLKVDRDTKQSRKMMLEQKIKDGQTLDQEYLMTKNSIIRLSNKFFSEVEQEEFIVLLNDLAKESKVTINGMKFSESDGTEAIQSFEQGRQKVDKYNELIAQDKIKGYIKQDPKEGLAPPEEKPKEEKPDASKVSVDPVPSGSDVSYADDQVTEEPVDENTNLHHTPDEVLKSEDPSAITYAKNIKGLAVDLTLEGSYSQIHEFVSLVALNERNIIVESIRISKVEDSISNTSAKNNAQIKLVFYKVLELEKYFEHKDSILVKQLVAKSSKASPFLSYSWNFTPSAPSSPIAKNSFGNQITLPQPPQSIMPPYQVYPNTMMPTPIPNTTELSTVPPSDPGQTGGSGYTRLPFGGYVQNPQPQPQPAPNKDKNDPSNLPQSTPSNTVAFNTLSGISLELNSNGATKNTGKLKLSDSSGLKRNALKLEYHLGDVGYYGAIKVNLDDKNIVLNKKATDIILKVKSEMLSGHNIGLEIIDADNMVHSVILYEDIDWTDWKDVRLLNLPRMSYPAKVKSIYISRVEDVSITDSVLYFDSFSYSYK